MALEDLPLDRPSSDHLPGIEPPAPPGPSPLRWIVVGLAGVAAGALLMFWWMSREQPTPAAPPSPTVLDNTSASNRPKRQLLNLPALGESDTLLRTLVSTLSDHPWLARLLATKGLVRGATMAVVQIGDGRTPSDGLRAIRPGSRVQILGSTTGRIDPNSYKRWDVVSGALLSVSPADAAQLYVNIKPLVDEAYIELGHGNSDFDQAVVRAIQMLADTPTPDGDPVLNRRPGYFEHDDPALRALRPVQKQFLLMGPDNRRRLLDWLHAFAKALDLEV
jgi:Protein of unknown function (DUF3014)